MSSVNDELLSAVGKLTAAYGRIGGNLNQIACYLNEYGASYNTLCGEVRASRAYLAALKYEVLKKVGDLSPPPRGLPGVHAELRREEDFAVACMRSNLRYGINQRGKM